MKTYAIWSIIMRLVMFSFLIFAVSGFLIAQVVEPAKNAQKVDSVFQEYELRGFFPNSPIVKIKNSKELSEPLTFGLDVPSEFRHRIDLSFGKITMQWLIDHPNSKVLEVHRLPIRMIDGSLFAIQTYVWVVDGDENLNIKLVENGACFAKMMLLDEEELAELRVTRKEYDEFRSRILAAQEIAKSNKIGLWASRTSGLFQPASKN